MKPLILDGKTLASASEGEITKRVKRLIEDSGGKKPVLATILVGQDPASATYVRMKANACGRVGMDSRRIELDGSTTTEELLAEIDKLNKDESVQGILLQHPVPNQIDEKACFDRISAPKDVDGVTSLGFGMMAMGNVSNYSNLEQHRIIYESLVKLTLHEVGHTLGLTHNFYSSNKEIKVTFRNLV